MTTVKVLPGLIVLLLIACNAQDIGSQLQDFNSEAKETFQKKTDMNLLKPLSDRDICLFSKVIENDLDTLNRWETSILFDRLMVRRYFDRHLSMTFSFIKDIHTDSMHFVAFPELDEWIYQVGKNYARADSMYQLKGAIKIVKINNYLFENFLKQSDLYLNNVSFIKKTSAFIKLFNHVGPSYITKEVSSVDALDHLKRDYTNSKISEVQLQDVSGLLMRYLVEDVRVQVYQIADAGYIVLLFEKTNGKGIDVSYYFIPSYRRQWMQSGTDNPDYGYEGCPGSE